MTASNVPDAYLHSPQNVVARRQKVLVERLEIRGQPRLKRRRQIPAISNKIRVQPNCTMVREVRRERLVEGARISLPRRRGKAPAPICTRECRCSIRTRLGHRARVGANNGTGILRWGGRSRLDRRARVSAQRIFPPMVARSIDGLRSLHGRLRGGSGRHHRCVPVPASPATRVGHPARQCGGALSVLCLSARQL